MGDFHYLVVPGADGGVERAQGPAIGLDLRTLLGSGLPPVRIALEAIAALAELIAVLEEDREPHGAIELERIFIDDTGILSLEGFGTRGAGGPSHDRFALGRVALELLGGGRFESPADPRDHEDAVLDRLLGTDLSGLDGELVGDVLWYLARSLDLDPEQRPSPVQLWRAYIAYASATPGPELPVWCAAAVDGGGERRSTTTPAAFSSKDALRAGTEPPPPGGGNKTAYWSREDLFAMESASPEAPAPRRCTGVALKRQETQIRTAEGSKPRRNNTTVLQEGLKAESAPIDDDRRQFSVERCLGRGGFGEVYLCSMSSAGGMRTQVAVKVLRDGIDPRAQAVRRLRDEARVLGTLQHPAILTALDLVLLADRVAMVTEYVPGADLDVCLEGQDPPPLRALLEVLAVTCEALDASWNSMDANGAPLRLVHRDIKPSNIRIGTHGQIKVLDFGIAKFASAREAKTQVNQMIGTLSYMAPERLSSANDHAAGDVYAIGAILYEALAGHGLWSDVTTRQQYLMSMVATEHDAFVQPKVDALDTTANVKALVRGALAFEPTERPTAAELGHALEDAADQTPGRNLRRWARDHTWPEPATFEADLVGRTITEGRGSTLNSGPMTASRNPPRSLASPTFSEDEAAAPAPAPARPPAPASTARLAEPAPSAVRHVDQTEFGAWFAQEPAEEAIQHTTFLPAPPEPPPSLTRSTVTLPATEPGAPPRQLPRTPAPMPRAVIPEPDPEPVLPTLGPTHASFDEPSVTFGPSDAGDEPDAWDDDPIPARSKAPWLMALVVGLVLLVVSGVAGAGIGLFALVGTGGSTTTTLPLEPIQPTEPSQPVEPTEPTEPTEPGEPVQPTQPVAPSEPAVAAVRPDGVRPVPAVPSTVPMTPVPGPVPGVVPSIAGATEPVPEPAPQPVEVTSAAQAGSVDACGELTALEGQAASGTLPSTALACLTTQMNNSALKMTDRNKLGRVALVQAQSTCGSAACPAYEQLQDTFFEDVDRSDPDMMAGYAQHLYKSAGASVPRLEKAILWAGRALERAQVWKGRTRTDRLLKLHELRARAMGRVYTASPTEANRELARDRAVEWAELRRSLNLDATEAFALCASAAGSMEVCDKRVTTDALTEQVTITSIPMRSKVFVDGKEVGATPLPVALVHGTHQLEIRSETKTSTQTIKVGAGQPVRWQWIEADDSWKSTL